MVPQRWRVFSRPGCGEIKRVSPTRPGKTPRCGIVAAEPTWVMSQGECCRNPSTIGTYIARYPRWVVFAKPASGERPPAAFSGVVADSIPRFQPLASDDANLWPFLAISADARLAELPQDDFHVLFLAKIAFLRVIFEVL